MSKRRRLAALITFAAVSFTAVDASACCLTDWLFGRSTAYAAGYAPYSAAYPYAANYGAVPVGYSAAYAPASPYAAAYPSNPLYSSAYGSNPFVQPTTPRYQISGVYQAQRPAYALNNPSVYTGMPVTGPATAQTSYSLPMSGASAPIATAYPPSMSIPAGSVPLSQSLRGNAPTSSFFGGNNAYPMQSMPSQSYSAAYATPSTAIPATQVAPPFVVPAQPRVGGLGRFFGALFGTNYRSSYYRAPVTYYRPVTAVDPVSGTTVTTQQGCTSYLDQLQRSPYGSLGANQPNVYQPTPIGQPTPFGQPVPIGQPVPVGSTSGTNNPFGAPSDSVPMNPPSLNGGQIPQSFSQSSAYGSASQYTPSPYSGSPYSGSPFGSVNQAGAVSSPSSSMTIPIPSTVPSSRYVPNTEPLSGVPSSTNGDRAPLDQPRLESGLPGQANETSGYRSDIDRYLDENRNGNSSDFEAKPQTKTEWRLQNPADSSVFGSNAKESSDRMITAANEEPSKLGYSSVHPIQAPPEYISPFQRRTLEVQPKPTESDRPLTSPPLPPSSEQPVNASNRDRGNYSIPVREAALVRERTFEAETRHQVNRTYQPEVRQMEARTPPKRKRQESGWGAIRP